MHILAIHAHPDDVEILAGGTLALLANQGHAITVVSMTPGDCGSHEHSADEIAAIRREEASRAAAVIGATYRCAEFRDLAIFSDDPSRRKIVGLLREIRPNIVMTAAPVDYLCDHEATSLLVRDACFAAPAPNYAAPGMPLDRIPHLYFMDPVGGVDRDDQPIKPDFVVNIAGVFADKRNMLAAHASQRNWLLKQHGMDDYLDTMERWTRHAGRHAGFEYGEGFRRYRGHPYPQTPVLEQLFPDAHFVV